MAFSYLKFTGLTVTVETWQLVHGKTVTSSSQSSLTTSTFGIADLLLVGWRPEAYVFLLLAARRPEEAYDICCWLLGVRKRMIFVAGGPAQGSWRLCSQVASYTKLAFSSNSNNSIPTTCQVSLLEDVQIHLPRSCRDQVSPFRPPAETHKQN